MKSKRPVFERKLKICLYGSPRDDPKVPAQPKAAEAAQPAEMDSLLKKLGLTLL